jgi:hypothetical protein
VSAAGEIERLRAKMVSASLCDELARRDLPAAIASSITRDGTIAIVSTGSGVTVRVMAPCAAVVEALRLARFAVLSLWRGRRWRWDR